MTEEEIKLMKEKRNEYFRNYRKKNLEKMKAYRKKWYSLNKDKQKEYTNRYFLKKAELES